jgi:hypothetical protein
MVRRTEHQRLGKGILSRTVNKQAGPVGEAPAGVGARTQQPGVGKLVRVVEVGKLHRRSGKTHSHVSCKQIRRPENTAAVSPPPLCLER